MDVWKGMTDTQRTYVEEACNAQIQWSMAVAMRPQGDQIAEFEAGGTEVRRFPAPVLAELEKYSAEVLNEEAAKDPLFKEALDSIKAFMAKANRWQSLQELPRTMN
jgi:TRAP-type mannitol/chloroaromatic compound transport system, periplasmic component